MDSGGKGSLAKLLGYSVSNPSSPPPPTPILPSSELSNLADESSDRSVHTGEIPASAQSTTTSSLSALPVQIDGEAVDIEMAPLPATETVTDTVITTTKTAKTMEQSYPEIARPDFLAGFSDNSATTEGSDPWAHLTDASQPQKANSGADLEQEGDKEMDGEGVEEDQIGSVVDQENLAELLFGHPVPQLGAAPTALEDNNIFTSLISTSPTTSVVLTDPFAASHSVFAPAETDHTGGEREEEEDKLKIKALDSVVSTTAVATVVISQVSQKCLQ